MTITSVSHDKPDDIIYVIIFRKLCIGYQDLVNRFGSNQGPRGRGISSSVRGRYIWRDGVKMVIFSVNYLLNGPKCEPFTLVGKSSFIW